MCVVIFCCLSLLYSFIWLIVVCARGKRRVYFLYLTYPLLFIIVFLMICMLCVYLLFSRFVPYIRTKRFYVCARVSLFKITNEYEPITKHVVWGPFQFVIGHKICPNTVEKKRQVSSSWGRADRTAKFTVARDSFRVGPSASSGGYVTSVFA